MDLDKVLSVGPVIEKENYCFAIVLKESTLILQAESMELMEQWVLVLRKALETKSGTTKADTPILTVELVDSTLNNACLHQGYLYRYKKRGYKKSWRKVWVVLRKQAITVYKNENVLSDYLGIRSE